MLNGAHRLVASMEIAQPEVKKLKEAEKLLGGVATATHAAQEPEERKEKLLQTIQMKTTWAVQLYDWGEFSHPNE